MKFLVILFLCFISFLVESDSMVSSPANSSDSIQNESKVLTDSISVDSLQIQDTIKVVEEWVTIYEKTGASWYGIPYHGRRTASGVIYNMNDLTFARQVKLSKVFKFGESYRVTNLANGKSVIVVCNDTGPLTPGRSIDLSKRAMSDLDGIHAGVIQVKIEKLKK